MEVQKIQFGYEIIYMNHLVVVYTCNNVCFDQLKVHITCIVVEGKLDNSFFPNLYIWHRHEPVAHMSTKTRFFSLAFVNLHNNGGKDNVKVVINNAYEKVTMSELLP